jgi:hypothetical protein
VATFNPNPVDIVCADEENAPKCGSSSQEFRQALLAQACQTATVQLVNSLVTLT